MEGNETFKEKSLIYKNNSYYKLIYMIIKDQIFSQILFSQILVLIPICICV